MITIRDLIGNEKNHRRFNCTRSKGLGGRFRNRCSAHLSIRKCTKPGPQQMKIFSVSHNFLLPSIHSIPHHRYLQHLAKLESLRIMSTPNLNSPALPITIPDRINGKLPITVWDRYFQVLTKRLAEEFPACDETQRANVALGHLQMIACGNAALDSLSVGDHMYSMGRL